MRLRKLFILLPIIFLSSCGDLTNFYDEVVLDNYIDVMGHTFDYAGAIVENEDSSYYASEFENSSFTFFNDMTLAYQDDSGVIEGSYYQSRRRLMITVGKESSDPYEYSFVQNFETKVYTDDYKTVAFFALSYKAYTEEILLIYQSSLV